MNFESSSPMSPMMITMINWLDASGSVLQALAEDGIEVMREWIIQTTDLHRTRTTSLHRRLRLGIDDSSRGADYGKVKQVSYVLCCLVYNNVIGEIKFFCSFF